LAANIAPNAPKLPNATINVINPRSAIIGKAHSRTHDFLLGGKFAANNNVTATTVIITWRSDIRFFSWKSPPASLLVYGDAEWSLHIESGIFLNDGKSTDSKRWASARIAIHSGSFMTLYGLNGTPRPPQ
jgi:hypothetical protein